MFGFAVVVLPQIDASLFGTVDYSLPSTIVQPGIGRKTNFFFLHRRIDIDAFELMRFYGPCLKPGLDRLLQQLFGTGFPNALSPTGHARGINWGFVLKELHSAEGLLVGIFHPPLNEVFIAEVEGVLQVVKRNHQSCTDSGSPGVGTIGRAEKLIEPIPVNDIGQLDQPMAGIDDAAKLDTEQV